MGKKFKVLLYESMHQEGTALLEEKCDVIYARSYDEKDLIDQVSDVNAVIIRTNGAVSGKLIEAAPKLKVIGRHGVGLDAIDLAAAKKKRVQVVYTPQANKESVAEHFVALALMLAKKIRLADIALRDCNWQARYELIGTELRGKTLGVLGFGRIGQQTARICHFGFGMPIVYYDPFGFPEVEKELGASQVDEKKLFKESDLISINMPLLPETKHFVNAKLLKLMKQTAFLINMARGPIWNETDIVEALKTKRIAGAGSDVYEIEPITADNPLLKLNNFVGTPHMSAHTEEAMIRMSMVARDVLCVLEGKDPEYPFLPD
ncbi:MAG TPA: hydroxyacid dehydrogenase [Desulfobacterales bacterium]|nr:hydroxyacid dehydrogenase [Desulfobacterales bacterium]